MAGKCFQFAKEARNRIKILTLTQVSDGLGGRTTSSEETAEVFAVVKPVSGFERFLGERIDSKVSHKIIIRYRPDMSVTGVAATKYVELDGRTLNVHYIRNLHNDMKSEGKHFQEIYAVEGDGVTGAND